MKTRTILGACAAGILVLLGSCVSSPTGAPNATNPPALQAPDGTGTVDFATIERLSEEYRVMRYQSQPAIRTELARYYDPFVLVDLPSTRNRYVLGTVRGEHRQEILIRGTANGRNVLYDLQFARRYDKRLGISLHAGFDAMAQALYADILPRLDKSDDLVIFGHSLGAAEAVILSMLLSQDGFRIAMVYASGGPRLTDREGEAKYDGLPILRIVNQGDPVPLLPPRDIPDPKDPYVHIGPAMLLLDGPAYCLLRDDVGDEAIASTFWKFLGDRSVRHDVQEHLIPAYIARLKPKLEQATQVPFVDRLKYLSAAN